LSEYEIGHRPQSSPAFRAPANSPDWLKMKNPAAPGGHVDATK
jgi:hypothetical protein